MKSVMARIEELERRLAVEVGPRGGKIIGYTRSGKPIYATANHASHSNFTQEDHHDAAAAHTYLQAEASKGGHDPKSWKLHKKQIDDHAHQASWNLPATHPHRTDHKMENRPNFLAHGKDIATGKFRPV